MDQLGQISKCCQPGLLLHDFRPWMSSCEKSSVTPPMKSDRKFRDPGRLAGVHRSAHLTDPLPGVYRHGKIGFIGIDGNRIRLPATGEVSGSGMSYPDYPFLQSSSLISMSTLSADTSAPKFATLSACHNLSEFNDLHITLNYRLERY